MSRRVVAMVMLSLLVAGMSGCETQPSSSTTPRARGIIGVSLLTLDNPFFKVIGDTITADAATRQFATSVVSAEKDPSRQANQIKDFIVQQAAAIVLSPCDFFSASFFRRLAAHERSSFARLRGGATLWGFSWWTRCLRKCR